MPLSFVKMASQQQQPGGPMSQTGLQQAASLQQQQQQLSQQQDFDPVHRFKMLIPQLKESLQVIMPRRASYRLKPVAEISLLTRCSASFKLVFVF